MTKMADNPPSITIVEVHAQTAYFFLGIIATLIIFLLFIWGFTQASIQGLRVEQLHALEIATPAIHVVHNNQQPPRT